MNAAQKMNLLLVLINNHHRAAKAWSDADDGQFEAAKAQLNVAVNQARAALLQHRPSTLAEVSVKAAYMASCRTFTEWEDVERKALVEALLPVGDMFANPEALDARRIDRLEQWAWGASAAPPSRPDRGGPMSIFTEMGNGELCDAIYSMVAIHHALNTEGSLASASSRTTRFQAWADGYCDRLSKELGQACNEYAKREIADPDEALSQGLALAAAFSWMTGGTFALTVTIHRADGSAVTC